MTAAIVLKAHRSNFKMTGFVEEPDLRDIAEAAHRAGLIVIDDLGSGALLDTAKYGLAHEPTVQESVAAGADLVCFSGDKLLGGPQAGIVIGKADLMAKLRKHPLARAVRADKMSLAGLAATLNHYLRDEAEREIPVWKMIVHSACRHRSGGQQSWAERLRRGRGLQRGIHARGRQHARAKSLPTYVSVAGCEEQHRIPAAGCGCRIRLLWRARRKGRVLLDPRTVLDGQDAASRDGLGSRAEREPMKSDLEQLIRETGIRRHPGAGGCRAQSPDVLPDGRRPRQRCGSFQEARRGLLCCSATPWSGPRRPRAGSRLCPCRRSSGRNALDKSKRRPRSRGNPLGAPWRLRDAGCGKSTLPD